MAAIGSKLYVAGGQDAAGHASNTLWEYDSGAGTWSAKATMLRFNEFAPLVAIGSKLYVPGGFGGPTSTSGIVLGTLDVWDQATNSWSTLAAMPVALAQHAAVTVGTKLYVAGGSPNAFTAVVNTLYVWDQATNSWSTLAAMPVALCNVAACAIGSKIYVSSGNAGSPNPSLTGFYEYDTVAGTWATKATMPTVGTDHAPNALVPIGAQVFKVVAGGFEVWDQGSNSWSTISDSPSDDVQGGVALLGSTPYLCCGRFGLSPLGILESWAMTPAASSLTLGRLRIA